MKKYRNKLFLTGLAVIFLALGLGGWFNAGAQQGDDSNLIDVWFQNDPLFLDNDVKPCHQVEHWIRVRNVSGDSQPIRIKAINIPDPIGEFDLSRALYIEIREGANVLYGAGATKTLFDFYNDSDPDGVLLLNQPAGNETEYFIKIIFPCEKGNEWQEATTYFDLTINAEGDETTPSPNPSESPGGPSFSLTSGGTGGGGGGPLPPSDAFERWQQQQGAPSAPAVAGDIALGPVGEVAGAVTSKPAGEVLAGTGFSPMELMLILAVIGSLFILRLVIKKYAGTEA